MQNWPDIFTALTAGLTTPVQLWIGFGSYFHQPYRQHSDIDLLGLTDADCREKKTRQLAGETFEMSLIGLQSFRQMLSDRHPVYVPLLMQGRYLAGDQDLFSTLQRQAQPIYQAGPMNFSQPAVVAGLRNRIRTTWQDLLDVRQQPELFSLCLAELAEQLISYHCGWQKIWRRGRKYSLLDFEQAAGPAARQLANVLRGDSAEARLALLRPLVQQVLAGPANGWRLEDVRINDADTLKAGPLSL